MNDAKKNGYGFQTRLTLSDGVVFMRRVYE